MSCRLARHLAVAAACFSAALAGDSVVVVNEIHYHPLNPALEFVELHNQLSVNVDLSGWRFDGGITFDFPEGTVIPARGYRLVAKDPVALQTATGCAPALGPFAGALANEGETLKLWNNNTSLRTLPGSPAPPAADELWSVDIQGDGAGGVYGQVPPTTMDGVESVSGLGNLWNAFTIASHPATTVNPAIDLVDSSGAASPLSFAITGTVSGFTGGASGGETPLYNDYLFLSAGNSESNITWRLAGVDPAKTYAIWLYGSAWRSVRIKVDLNGDGSLADDTAVTAPANGGILVSGIVPQPNGQILGNADTPGGEVNWAGFQLVVPADGGATSFDPGVYSSSLDRRRLMEELTYQDRQPWPVGPDGSGFTLAKIDPQGGGQAENWATSAQVDGTPGSRNFPEPVTSPLGVLDSSGQHRDATHIAGVTLTSGGGGYQGEALVCDGAGAVDVPVNLNPAQVPSATIGAWVWASGIDNPARHEILSTDNGSYDRALAIDSRSGTTESGVARYCAFGGKATGIIAGMPATTADGWVFVCAAFDADAAETRLYVDGNSYSGALTHNASQTFLRIGSHPSGIEPFRGMIDNVFAFDRALSASEIADLRSGGAAAIKSPALAENLMALYEFETPEDPATVVPSIALNEISGSNDGTFLIELYNYGNAAIELDGWLLVDGGSGTTYPFAATTLDPGTYMMLDETMLGFRPAADSPLFLRSPSRLVDAARVATTPLARQTPGSGRWLQPDAPTFGTANTFAIPDTIVINEIFHSAFDRSEEEWLELKNRSEQAIDLTGWQFTDGIHYEFPPGTTIEPGQFLIVAKDRAALLAKYPDRTIIGDFSGRLGDQDSLILSDPNGNPADEVSYFSDAPWPVDADRGGASLELRDAVADNARPEAWQASASAHLGTWQTITYRGEATDDGIGNDTFNDFMLGMLSRGEMLIDDLSVREDPDGTNIEFIDNGTFESDAIGSVPEGWRCLGNHGQGRSIVVTDPDNPSNPCLRVVATGATEDKSNRIETTFAGTRRVEVGRTYQISFRARWLAGSNQLNTRLYFNYLQRTSLLDVGNHWGTPGLENSSVIANLGPTATELAHQPVVPNAAAVVTVSVRLADPQGVASASLDYRVGSGSWQSAPMALDGAGRHRGSVPGQAAGALVQFAVTATDTLGAVTRFPANGAFWRVSNNDVDASGLRGNLRVLVSPEDEALLFTATNRMSNDTVPATVIEDEHTVYYGCQMRLKGSAFGRYTSTETGYNIDFPAHQPFRGVHASVSIERAGNLKEIVAKHLLNRAGGGYWSQFDDVAKVSGPGASGISLIAASRTTNTFLKSLFPELPVGPVFNHELLYQPNGTVDGKPRSLKLNNPYNHDRGSYELADRGADPEAYRWGWQLRNQRRDDDYSSIVRLNRAFALSGSAFTSEIEATIDVDQWMRTWAIMGLYGNDDQYGRLYAHNWRLYQRPSDGRLIALPWDLDRAFNLGSGAPLTPTAFKIRDLFAIPAYRRAFDQHLLDLTRTTFNSIYLTDWVDHLASVTGEGTGFAGISGYLSSRGRFALTTLPVRVPFAITTHDGADFTTTANTAELAGSGWSDIDTITVNGRSAPLSIIWTGPTAWSTTVPLVAGANVITLTARDPHAVIVGTDSITVTSTTDTVIASAANIVISELHYHPADPSVAEVEAGFTNSRDFEFIELLNISRSQTVNLTRASFSAGITYTFTEPTLIPPGERVVLPRRAAAFAMRHPDVPSASEYFISSNPTGNQLDNGGEELTLVDPDGIPIKSFIYDDVPPWPTAADGTGRSLVLIAPFRNPDHNDPLSWRASFADGGNPGASDSTPFLGNPTADANHNGQADLIDYALGGGVPPTALPNGAGGLFFTVERDLAAEVALGIEWSTDLAADSWQPVMDGTLRGRLASTGTLERLIFSVPPAVGEQRLFLRVKVTSD